MKLSSKSITAIKLFIDLGEHYNEGFTTLVDISKRKDISKKFLEQIIPLYRNSNLLIVSRGNQGGYKLAKSANEITLKDIIYVTELSFNKTNTMDSVIDSITDGIDSVLENYFSSVKLSDLIEKQIDTYSLNYCI